MKKAQELWQEVEKLKQEINRLRYLGQDPTVDISTQDNALTIAAKVIAAERLAARIRYNGTSINPVEDLALEALQRATVSLQFWNFYATRLFLDEAAHYTRDPETFQRIALLRLVADFVAAIVRMEPGHRQKELAKQARSLKRAIDTLDLLSMAERQHYAAEVDRLRALWRQASRDRYLHALWCLVRARRSMDEEEPLLGLAWLIRSYALLAEGEASLLQPSAYLRELVEKAKGHLAVAMGQAQPPEEAEEEVRAAELFAALTTLVAVQLNRNPERDMSLFNIHLYQPTDGS
jgi:hypothetical protein